MSDQSASLVHVSDAGARPGVLQVFGAALLASLIAGTTGLLAVFGRGLIEAPGIALIGLVYALVPGILGLLAVHALLRKSRAGTGRDLANCASLSAVVALLWLLPFIGLFVPTDGPNASAASGGLAVYHVASGAVGGAMFWLLAGRWRRAVERAERPA